MPVNKEYLDFVLDWLSPLGDITSRAMMGGQVLYCSGVVFALIAENALYLKADDQTRGRHESLKLKAFQPFPDKPGVMSYYLPPPEFFEDEDVMKDWGREAVEAGRRAQAGKKPRARARRPPSRRG